jgi:hypothetical protein
MSCHSMRDVPSTSITTGALQVAGGAGMVGNVSNTCVATWSFNATLAPGLLA